MVLQNIKRVYRMASGIFLMLMLAWLTISIPFVYAAQDAYYAKIAANGNADAASDCNKDNPFANTTEEKTVDNSGTNFSEEYLHNSHVADHFKTELAITYRIEHTTTYIAFYGEMVSPPPDTI